MNCGRQRYCSSNLKPIIERVQAGMGSDCYATGPLAANEILLKDFVCQMHETIPLSRHTHEPDTDTLRHALDTARKQSAPHA